MPVIDTGIKSFIIIIMFLIQFENLRTQMSITAVGNTYYDATLESPILGPNISIFLSSGPSVVGLQDVEINYNLLLNFIAGSWSSNYRRQ